MPASSEYLMGVSSKLGQAWATSVWHDRAHGTLLPVPKRRLGGKQAGDVVSVSLRPRDA